LTHGGEHEFKTVFGGVLTIILIVGLLAYGGQGLTKVTTDKIETLSEEIQWTDVDETPYFNPGML